MRAGEHVADESLVPGHIDHPRTGAIVGVEVRKAEIDRDPACALLFESIGLDTGERFDQRRLTVIDVPGSANDDGR
jgi:hypothetical protein